ncbi:type III pantothenate kinase [Myroides odoratus]|jgi:type III pantothenate kinase|uniref:Type III pantothenate kinase n=1 Tax=Myroides odoratus TaxID=256 RepID=A0A9Q6Z7I2_MYROD|nr:type III pantothenate kinase [Myroides odoratus]EHQ43163.1 putative transcriptional acitvator, Baf family [Myroides odoratus DSM 2801]EKB06548.1 pantothenate kinase, type III [Myroides odoratus CIP 103059]MDR0224138.1 type III pantothenate kinase [Myroides odoratus]QQU00507.1 type III pantothenate kinase [Myroides odoratus]WQD57260.1 type III pantothenate kinase [Myroides odoratus]
MIYTLDIGNTRTKLAMFENNSLLKTEYLSTKNLQEELLFFLKKNKTKPQIILASVVPLDSDLLNWLQMHTDFIQISHTTPLPVANKYQTPHTLGIDRLVVAAGSTIVYPNTARLIIDAGTCITYDFVNTENEYLGGAISPGLQLRYKALNDYTAKLPYLQTEDINYFIGKNTNESIQSGVINGIVAEIDNIIDHYKKDYSDLTIILTGGDTVFLAKRLKNIIFANPNFLSESLNHIYQYIIENDKKNHS